MKRKNHSHLPFALLTDKGLVRDHNEDNLSLTAFGAVSDLVPESLLCVLCDGSGRSSGRRNCFSTGSGPDYRLCRIIRCLFPVGAADGCYPVCKQSGLADRVKLTRTARNGVHGGMCLDYCKRLFTATIGDSRIYLIKHGRVYQISTDHTWLQEALEAGQITQADFKGHPNAHVIKRYVGSETPPDVDIRLRLDDNPTKTNRGCNWIRETCCLCAAMVSPT